MEVGIGKTTKELLDSLKEGQIQLWKQQNRDDIADIFERMDYNDLVMVLHLGFSEKAFYESMQGIVTTSSFRLSEEEINKIKQGLNMLSGGT